MKLTIIIRKGERQYLALCPELDVVSQGYTIEEAMNNIKEAIGLYIEVSGLPDGSNNEIMVTSIEVMDNAETAKAIR